MQYNFSDPESRIMKGADGLVQAYNAQVAVEPDFQLIVGQQVTQEGNDKQQMKPMVEVIQEQSGQKPAEVVSDSGYCSDANLGYLEKKKIEAFVVSFASPNSGCTRLSALLMKLFWNASLALLGRLLQDTQRRMLLGKSPQRQEVCLPEDISPGVGA